MNVQVGPNKWGEKVINEPDPGLIITDVIPPVPNDCSCSLTAEKRNQYMISVTTNIKQLHSVNKFTMGSSLG